MYVVRTLKESASRAKHIIAERELNECVGYYVRVFLISLLAISVYRVISALC